MFLILGSGVFNVENCLLKTQLTTDNTNFFLNNLVNQDPLFNEVDKDDYSLLVGSPCADVGKTGAGNLMVDLAGITRLDPPDIGAYEVK